MTKGKKIALAEALIGLLTLAVMIAAFVVFITYDVAAMNAATDNTGEWQEQLGEGIARVFIIIFIILGFLALIPSVLLSLVSTIGQFVLGVGKRGVPTLGFVIVGLIGKLLATVVLFFITTLLLGIKMDGPVPAIIHITLVALMFASFVWSIVALVLRKKVLIAERSALDAAQVAETEAAEEVAEEIAPTQE